MGEAGGPGQTDHGETVEGRAVGTVMDNKIDGDVLLCVLLRGNVMFPKRGDEPGGSAQRD